MFKEMLRALVRLSSYLQRICFWCTYITTEQDHEGHFTVHKVFVFWMSSLDEGKKKKRREKKKAERVNDTSSKAVIDIINSVYSGKIGK